MITFKIRGNVRVAETGVGLSGLFLKAYDKDLLFDDLLGSTYTKEDGRFEIISEPEDFRDFFEAKPDIYLKIFSPDTATLLYSTEKGVRWQAGRLEEFDVRIPRESLGGLAPAGAVHLLDEHGEERSSFEIGESLTAQIEGVHARRVHDLVLLDERGAELFTSGLLSNRAGVIEATTLWPQFGLDDPRSGERFTVEQAQERWRGRALKFEVRVAGKKMLEQVIRIADAFTRPLLLSTDMEGVVLNGFEIGRENAVVSGYNLPFHGTIRVFMVDRQHDWLPGNPFAPVGLSGGRLAMVDLEVEENQRSFRTRLARARELQPGAYDFIVRHLRYGYEDDEDLVLRSTDLVTRSITGLVVREKFMSSKAVLGGCANTQPMSGRSIAGAPYFQYADTFQVGEPIYAALDPAALDPNLMGKMVAIYVVKRPVPNYQSLQHLPVLGGNPAVKKIKTQSGCINFNKQLIWPSPGFADVGEYDIVADFGNNTADAAAFQPNASFDQPSDLIDGYFTPGFRIVPDPTLDTHPNIPHYGTWSYTESIYGTKTVPDDGNLGSPVMVPLRAYVRFPADSANVTDPAQISTAQASYPLLVAVHGNGHDYGNYHYLLNHWARNGFIAASIYLLNINNQHGMGGTGRAKILFEHLTILKNKFGAKAANNIGIMGHSRGGEAVVIAARLNHEGGLGHGINAIISLAPTDKYTLENLGGAWATPYFVLYGAMDGDVAGPQGTGFRLYDRASGKKKSMVFVYGATHDRFNLINQDFDMGLSSLGPTDMPKILAAATHRTIAQAYMTAFYRWQLRNEGQWEGIFRGEWVPAAVAQAEAGKVKLYVQYSDPTTAVIDHFEGPHTPTSWQVSTIAGAVDDYDTLPGDPVEDELIDLDPHSPHATSGLLLRWDDTGDKLEFKPDNPVNASAFAAFSFRVTQKVDSSENLVDQIQDLYLTLTDTNNKSRAIKVSKFGKIPPPQKREKNQYTKSALTTVRIPLHVFKIEVINTDKVDLQNIKTLTFEFKAQPKGEIEIDSVEFTN